MDEGGYFHTSHDRRHLLPVSEKPMIDGVESSGNAWGALALHKLSSRNKQTFYASELEDLLSKAVTSPIHPPEACLSLVKVLATWTQNKL